MLRVLPAGKREWMMAPAMPGARSVLPMFVVLVGTSAASSAWARAIVVERPDATDQVLVESFSRLCGELGMYGLEVRVVDPADLATPPGATAAREGGPGDVVAGIAFVRSAGQASARIWIESAVDTRETVSITISGDANAPTLLAIRAADLLRTNLRDIDRPIAAVAAAPKDAPPPASTRVRRWSLLAGGSALYEDELGFGLAPTVQIGRRLTDRLALTLDLVGPVGGQSYRLADATARVGAAMASVAVAFRAFERSAVAVEFFQGLGAARLTVHGEAQAPWSAQDASAWVSAASSGARLVVRVAAPIHVSVSLAAVFFLPRPVIDLGNAGHAVGAPVLLSSAGLGLDL